MLVKAKEKTLYLTEDLARAAVDNVLSKQRAKPHFGNVGAVNNLLDGKHLQRIYLSLSFAPPIHIYLYNPGPNKWITAIQSILSMQICPIILIIHTCNAHPYVMSVIGRGDGAHVQTTRPIQAIQR